MISIGKYSIYFTPYHWLQISGPVRVKRILFMTIYWKVKPSDVNNVQQPPTLMGQEGRRYHYIRVKGGKNHYIRVKGGKE